MLEATPRAAAVNRPPSWRRALALGAALSSPALGDAAEPSLSVGDGAASERSGAVVFTVALAPASAKSVTVRYATSDVTATADDYEAAGETLTFAPGETEKTVVVTVSDDTVDEADETFAVKLSEAVNATVGEGTATGMIVDDDGPPNVLFISVDDLGDWIEPLGGHPQARTPNIDTLAKRGVSFLQAHAAAPLCNPSRAALLTGVAPHKSGVYENSGVAAPKWADVVHLPEAFKRAGYWAGGSGKIYHADRNRASSWDEYWPSVKKDRPANAMPKRASRQRIGERVEWGPLDIDTPQTSDGQVSAWVAAKLREPHAKPFFLAYGLFRPHRPWHVPKKYFDLFPLESVVLPKVKDDDLADVPEAGRLIAHDHPTHRLALESGKWRAAVQGYLAAISFADDLVGTVMTALDESGRADSTIVVLFGDHGWHLGEKEHWNKRTLWEEATRVPLVIYAPSGTPGLSAGTRAGKRAKQPVNLLDVYPTLLELAGLPAREHLDGRSLVPLLGEAEPSWPPTVTTHLPGNHAVRSEHLRYIRYSDGSEELYDHRKDPMEWTNLASDAKYARDKEALKAHLPETSATEHRMLLSATALEVAEGSSASYTVALSRRPKKGSSNPVTVTVSGAAGDVGVEPLELLFDRSNWDAPQTVTVSAAHDDDDETDPPVTLTHRASGPRYNQAPAATLTVAVTEDDSLAALLPGLSIADAEAEEGASLSFGVALTSGAARAASVRWETQDGTATAGSDYEAANGVLEFAAGETSKTVSVRALEDTVVEADETFAVKLVGANGALVDEATGTITDATPVREVSALDATAAEGTELAFRVALDGPAAGPVTLRWETADGTAMAGADYEAGTGRLEFAAGEREKTVLVSTLTDVAYEASEAMVLRLSGVEGGELADGEATGTIRDATERLRGRVVSAPSEHGGHKTTFKVRIEFSEDVRKLVARAFEVEGGVAKRVNLVDRRRDLREVFVRARSEGDLTLTLPATEDCASDASVCTFDGRPLASGLSVTVAGPASATASVDGPLLTIAWPTPRDGFAAPHGSDFAVRVNGAWRGVADTAVHGSRVVLVLASPVVPGEFATVDYLGSSMHPLRALNGVEAAPWEDLPAVNVTAAALPPGAAGRLRNAAASRAGSSDVGGPALSLRLGERELQDGALAALAGDPGPMRLDLSGSALKDLSALAHLRALESLDLSGNAVADVWPLAGLGGLRRLDLRDNVIVDVSALAELTELEVLLLDGNDVADIGPLSHLTRLENLGLKGNRVGDTSPLADLGALRRLDLRGNPVADLSPIGDLGTTLVWLGVPDGAVGVPIYRLVQLRWLRALSMGTCIECGSGALKR